MRTGCRCQGRTRLPTAPGSPQLPAVAEWRGPQPAGDSPPRFPGRGGTQAPSQAASGKPSTGHNLLCVWSCERTVRSNSPSFPAADPSRPAAETPRGLVRKRVPKPASHSPRLPCARLPLGHNAGASAADLLCSALPPSDELMRSSPGPGPGHRPGLRQRGSKRPHTGATPGPPPRPVLGLWDYPPSPGATSSRNGVCCPRARDRGDPVTPAGRG